MSSFLQGEDLPSFPKAVPSSMSCTECYPLNASFNSFNLYYVFNLFVSHHKPYLEFVFKSIHYCNHLFILTSRQVNPLFNWLTCLVKESNTSKASFLSVCSFHSLFLKIHLFKAHFSPALSMRKKRRLTHS